MAKRKSNPGTESPTCNCILLCDDVLVSVGKGKHFLQGVIGVIAVTKLPAVLGGYVAYVRVSNVYPAQVIEIKLERASDGAVLLDARPTFPPHPDPLGVYTFLAPVPPFRVEEPGRHLFTAYHNGVPFAQTPIEIRLLKRQRGK
jgi:hypothetical protein